MLLLNILGYLSGPPVLNMGAHCEFLRSHFFKLCVRGGNQTDDGIKLGIRGCLIFVTRKRNNEDKIFVFRSCFVRRTDCEFIEDLDPFIDWLKDVRWS